MIYLDLDKDGLTGGLQLSIGDDSGGHRIAGPKYSGHSSRVQRKLLSAHDAEEIRAYLDKGFPRPEDPKDIIIRTLRSEVERLVEDMESLVAAGRTGKPAITDLSWTGLAVSAAAARALLARLEARP